jgi:hypothetical protein
MSNVRAQEHRMALPPTQSAVFGVTHPLFKRLLAIAASALWVFLLLVVVGNFLENVIRTPPSFGSLLVVEGDFVSGGLCRGKGNLRGFDLTLVQGTTPRLVRVPCVEGFTSLKHGTHLKLHLREVSPLMNGPPFTELWHATLEGKVIYSYESRLTRALESRWVGYALVLGVFLLLGAVVWLLSRSAWTEAIAGRADEP